MFSNKKLSSRKAFLAVGVFAMLFSGVLYAWSILKDPFAKELGFEKDPLSLNFTLTMCFFCIGVFVGSKLFKKIGTKFTILIAAVLVGLGFSLTSLVSTNITVLYIFYGVLAGGGIGIAYNGVLSTVNAWFPDKKGFCSGMLMMAFGASTLVLGKIIEYFFKLESIGWKKTYIILGVVLAVVLIIVALILKTPHKDVVFPQAKANKKLHKENFESKDYTTLEMIKRFSFWRALLCLICLTAVGNSVIGFAKDLVESVGAAESLAVTLVGVLSVCNGFGRILTGALFDAVGRRKTMLAANIVTILAAGVTLIAVTKGSLTVCIIGLCLTGISYGACPTLASAFTSAFYGQKYFPSNFSITNFNLVPASFIATACASLVSGTNYTAPFILLLALSVVALGLNISIKKP